MLGGWLLMAGIAVAEEGKEYYEIRQFVVAEDTDVERIDEFLSRQMLPALKRAGAKHVGIFAPAAGAQVQDRFAIIVSASASDAGAVAEQLRGDSEYLSARAAWEAAPAKENSAKAPAPYRRLSGELLIAMDTMPQAKLPTGIGSEATRVYELRVYESANEGLGDRKVEMFNSGEVPIFLDCGIEPVFLGQALLGPYAPSLTYLTAYPDDQSRLKSWEKFRQHPDWKVLSGLEKYQGTVSKIHLFLLRPLPGSEL